MNRDALKVELARLRKELWDARAIFDVKTEQILRPRIRQILIAIMNIDRSLLVLAREIELEEIASLLALCKIVDAKNLYRAAVQKSREEGGKTIRDRERSRSRGIEM